MLVVATEAIAIPWITKIYGNDERAYLPPSSIPAPFLVEENRVQEEKEEEEEEGGEKAHSAHPLRDTANRRAEEISG